MPESCAKYREWLSVEYYRLLAWGKAAGIIEDEHGEKIGISLGADPLELITIVSRIDIILRDFTDLNARYNELHPEKAYGGTTAVDAKAAREEARDKDVTTQILSLELAYNKTKKKRDHMLGTNHVRASASALWELGKNPKRFRWVMRDEKTFTELLKDLRFQRKRLQELISDYQARTILDHVSKTYLEILQTKEGIDELKTLLEATKLIPEYTADSSENDKAGASHNEVLGNLVRLKSLNVQRGELSVDEILKETFQRFEDLKDPRTDSDGRIRATLKDSGIERQVWIEWKRYKTEWLNHDDKYAQIHPATVKRTAALAKMLNLPKPPSFSTPHCLGFFDDKKRGQPETRFGWIFQLPKSATPATELKSLLNMIKERQSSTPSLNVRIALASELSSSVLYLHSVNWLHKAIRSANILFQADGKDTNLKKFFLSGFDYSRPGEKNATSEIGDNLPRTEIYRWPTIQGNPPRAEGTQLSRKTYDIYALGLLLLEIVCWKPLHEILKLEKHLDDLGYEETSGIRKMLLETNPDILNDLKISVGEKLHGVIKKCVVAHGAEGFGVEEDEDQDSGAVGLRLQDAFMKDAVDVLKSIRV
jgi:hypothetical protein